MKTLDMTNGNLKLQIMKFAIPMFLASLIQNLYNITDKIWVGRFLGKIQLTAVGTVGPIVFLILSLSIGMAVSIAVLISQDVGSGSDTDNTSNADGIILKTIDTSLLISVLISILMTISGYIWFEPVLRLMGTAEDVRGYAKIYMNIVLLGTPFVFYTNAAAAILRGMGDPKTPTIIIGISAFINMVLDPIIITGIGLFTPMGIFGTACITVFSQIVGFILSHIKIMRLRKKYSTSSNLKTINFCKENAGIILKLGFPASVQQGLLSIANMLVLSIVNSYDNSDISSAFWAGHSFDSLAFLPAFAIGAAVSASAGQNTGSKSIERIKQTTKIGILYVTITNLILLLTAYFFAPYIAGLFLPNDLAAMEQTVIYLKIFCFYYIPFGLMNVLNSVIQGVGNTWLPMLTTVLSVYIIRLPLANYLAYQTDFGIKGVYIGMTISPIFGLVAILIYYLLGSWKKRVEKGKITA